VVLFWNMELVKEGPLRALDEVDKVVWLTRGEALHRLDHSSERELLVEALELRHFEPPPEAELRRPARRLTAAGRRESVASTSGTEPATAAAKEAGAEAGGNIAVGRAEEGGASEAEVAAHHERTTHNEGRGNEFVEPKNLEHLELNEAGAKPGEPADPGALERLEGIATNGAPEAPPPLPRDVAPRRYPGRHLVHLAAGTCAMAAAGVAARWFGPPGSVPVAVLAAAIGWLATVATVWRPRSGGG